jgi:arginine exporter protein ArgO
MTQKLAWFLLGAAFASLIWAIVMSVLNQQLLQTFFGFGGH